MSLRHPLHRMSLRKSRLLLVHRQDPSCARRGQACLRLRLGQREVGSPTCERECLLLAEVVVLDHECKRLYLPVSRRARESPRLTLSIRTSAHPVVG